MKKEIFYVLLFLISTQLYAQTGILTGQVKDKKTGETLIGATIVIEGTQKGTITDFDGNFILPNIEAGNYNIICSYISYESQITSLIINDNDEKVINFDLEESVISLDEVTVVAEKRRETEQMLLVERKESSLAIESIGANELSQKGAGTVAAGVKKVTGVSMIGSKQLFVRGLGDRYNSAQLNGLPIASPDPSKKIIKLDIFPTNIVEAITVSKVYSVQNYADYTGALIDIETKDYPLVPFINISGGIGMNTNSTFNEFIKIDNEGLSYFGTNTKTRKEAIPEDAKTYSRGAFEGNIFGTDFLTETFNAAPNTNFAVAGGKLYNIGKKQLGVLVSSSFDNEYVFEPSALNSYLRTDGTNNKYYVKKAYQYGTTFSNLLNLHYKSNAFNSISYNLVFLVNSLDEYGEAKGRNYDGETLYYNTGVFESHQLFNNQLIGKNKIKENLNLNWAIGYGNASSNLPDARIIALIDYNNNPVDWHYYRRNAQETKRMVTELNENEFSGKINTEQKFNDNSKLIYGVQSRYKMRKFDAFFYYYNIDSLQDIVTTPQDAPALISNENIENGNIKINNGSTFQNKYDASLFLTATYINYIRTYFNNFTIDIGLRSEIGNMIITTRNNAGRTGNIEQKDFDILKSLFPALNLQYRNTEISNIRFAASRTITRPSFYEKSPNKIPPIGSAYTIIGNPYLTNSYSYNFEAKYEIFPNPGELWSVDIYGKLIQDPIEMVTGTSGGDDFYTFKNSEKGIAAGVEVEGKKKFNNIFAGFNASYIYTKINIQEDELVTNKVRALQGASPYLINADLGYEYKTKPNIRSSIALVYNVYGKRIWAVGSDQKGDTYELPFHTFDIIMKNKIFKKLDINIQAKNIMNSVFTLSQDYYNTLSEITNGETLTSYEVAGEKEIINFKKGIEYGISLSYKF